MKPLLLLTLTTTLTLAQGPLAPPATPAPTMKSLDQIEPRTAISASTTISTPGSYYFTRSFAGDITIQASDVTLDLNGFTLTGNQNGVTISSNASYRNITLRNGSIVGPGTMTFTGPIAGTFSGSSGQGIAAYAASGGNVSAQNIRIENITIRGFLTGIYLTANDDRDGGRHLIFNCIVRDFGNYGIFAWNTNLRDIVVHSGVNAGVEGQVLHAQNLSVNHIDGDGISGTSLNLEHTTVRSCSGNGITATSSQISGGQISTCGNGISGSRNQVDGINIDTCTSNAIVANSSRISGGQISICAVGISGSDNQIDGISIKSCTGSGILSSNSSVTHVTAAQNAGAGIWADSSTIAHCTVRASGADGIRGLSSVISNCKSSGNDTNTTDGYSAAGIVWNGGRQIDNVCDLYAPAAPAP
jgi:hypothetical protein